MEWAFVTQIWQRLVGSIVLEKAVHPYLSHTNELILPNSIERTKDVHLFWHNRSCCLILSKNMTLETFLLVNLYCTRRGGQFQEIFLGTVLNVEMMPSVHCTA